MEMISAILTLLQGAAATVNVWDTVTQTDLIHVPDLMGMLLRFGINMCFTWFIIHFLYFAKSKRADFYFTFLLMGISTFFMVFMLGDVKFKTGFALGLFAIFSIMRFRTEGLPVREMAYLFAVVGLSVINALTERSYIEFLLVNLIVVLAIWFFDSRVLLKPLYSKLIQYDRIELIVPERRAELIEDLEKRVGVKIVRLQIGAIDFLKDMAVIKIFYASEPSKEDADLNNKIKLKRADLTEV